MALAETYTAADHNEQIFIIDDNPINLGVLYNYLTNYYPRVSVFQDPEEALTAVKTELPDIILLDIMMPEVDGFELCRRIKSDA
ncbi:MAG: response regulator, partial [Spirochaetia bacterium]